METTTQLQTIKDETPLLPSFSDSKSFEHAQRVAKMLVESSLIPSSYQKNIPNTMIALEMANRIGASPLMVMQNLYIVQGRPSWSSSFIISALNACGRFERLKFKLEGTGMNMKCRAWTYEKGTKELLEGSEVTMQMAKEEEWIDKNGSKWKTMPEQMIRYRAAAFFGRLYAPDILMGMHSEEEVADFVALANTNQISLIESLLQTSTLDEKQRKQVEFDIRQDISFEEAQEHIRILRANQLSPIDSGNNYSQSDIQKKQRQIINEQH